MDEKRPIRKKKIRLRKNQKLMTDIIQTTNTKQGNMHYNEITNFFNMNLLQKKKKKIKKNSENN